MVSPAQRLRFPVFDKRLIIIVGGYGSGKSEVAVNLSRHLAMSQPKPVAIADLDIVNPYFRSREAAEALAALGIRTLQPPGEQSSADLPIIIPEIKGAIEGWPGVAVLDVGGDDAGARVLSSLADSFEQGSFELLFTLNGSRPFTADVEGCLRIIEEIEIASRLKLTGIISNTHLLQDTTTEIVMAGLELARKVGERAGLPLVFLSSLPEVIDSLDYSTIDIPVLPLERRLLKPWERDKE